ncbi:MAG: type II toxin-antitoxin system YafQ family toxin [Muribaculaceae bacterium]|nr:type II toxin-antitoxin system YafQ family toxin [Muribaculaceae bacterium]
MRRLRYTSQFKKDVKRVLNQPKKLAALNEVLHMLQNEIPLPERYRQHSLQGNYKDCFECHIEGDFLLIWFDEINQTIALFRLGSHSELFGK